MVGIVDGIGGIEGIVVGIWREGSGLAGNGGSVVGNVGNAEGFGKEGI